MTKAVQVTAGRRRGTQGDSRTQALSGGTTLNMSALVVAFTRI